jgi:bacterioferritin-associated ferredoxin
MIICSCSGDSCSDIRECLRQGCPDIKSVQSVLEGICGDCKQCRKDIVRIIKDFNDEAGGDEQ